MSPLRPHADARTQLLAAITAILVISGLRASYSVTMPLAAAAVTIAAVWPLKQWLDRAMSSALSYIGTLLVLLLVFSGFMAAVYFSAAQIVRAFASNQEQFKQFYSALTDWAGQWGIDTLGALEGYNRLIDFGQMLLSNVYTVLVYLGFIAILVVLGLPAVPVLRANLSRALNAAERRELIDTIDEIAIKVRQYVGITALTSLITGLASALWAFTIGLELALVWGLLNFLLNFIPVVGNIIGILPPTLYAAIQFQSLTTTLVVFAGFSILQIAISNFLYPALQGHRLALPAVVIVIAIAIWTWIWGIAGAVLAVPLTATLLIAGDHFRTTGWLVKLLSGSRDNSGSGISRRPQDRGG
ncbi:AI-2E family transporter [Pseudorhodoplanes sp.]|uniref:AI-2E family transporter n=1 Tax=Pseudorhodoplanes sp. TaxID=1934341 RepID=UPI003D0C1C7F